MTTSMYCFRLAPWQMVWVVDEIVRAGGNVPEYLPALLGSVVELMAQHDEKNKNNSKVPLRLRPWLEMLTEDKTVAFLKERVPAAHKNAFAGVDTLPAMRQKLQQVADGIRDAEGAQGRARLLSDLMRLYALTDAFYEYDTDFINSGVIPTMLGFKSRPAMSPGMVGALRLPVMDVEDSKIDDAQADKVRSELRRVILGELAHVKQAKMGSGASIAGCPAIDVCLGVSDAQAIVAAMCP